MLMVLAKRDLGVDVIGTSGDFRFTSVYQAWISTVPRKMRV